MSDYITQRCALEKQLYAIRSGLWLEERDLKECQERIKRIEGYVSDGVATEWLKSELARENERLPLLTNLVASRHNSIQKLKQELEDL